MKTQEPLFDLPKKEKSIKTTIKYGPAADAFFGYKARLYVSGIIADWDIKLTPVHPHLKEIPPHKRKECNTIMNRLQNFNLDEAMGLDYLLECGRNKNKILIIIRWFSDANIFIKDVSGLENLLSAYQNAYFLYLPQPTRKGKHDVDTTFYNLSHYHLQSFSFFQRNGRRWEKQENKHNKNRWVLYMRNSMPEPIPKAFPANGSNDRLFEKIPSLQSSLKNLCI